MDFGALSRRRLIEAARRRGLTEDQLREALRKHGLRLDTRSYTTDADGRFTTIK